MKNLWLLVFAVFVGMATISQGASLPYLYSVYAIRISSIEPKQDVGSGFLLQASNSVYVVTARHVVFHLEGTNGWKLNHKKIEVNAFTALGSLTNEQQVTFTVDVNLLLTLDEVRYQTNRDIALIRIEQCDPTNNALVNFLPGVQMMSPGLVLSPTPENRLKRPIDASIVGSDVFLFGYPNSIGIPSNPRIDPTHPLLRKGIIAGINPSQQTIILDCPVYQGNSGGPAILRQQVNSAQWEFYVIGIAVEWIPFLDVWESKRFRYTNETLSNSGYSVVESSESILSLVWR